jgi:hypothetical protein
MSKVKRRGSIQEAIDGKFITWMEHVTDEQYLAGSPKD